MNGGEVIDTNDDREEEEEEHMSSSSSLSFFYYSSSMLSLIKPSLDDNGNNIDIMMILQVWTHCTFC